ncbi:MAG: hypothetical protein J6B29_04170 [Clostridia bacterium]|nr:hypothetical protein [Clostridia bacterium]
MKRIMLSPISISILALVLTVSFTLSQLRFAPASKEELFYSRGLIIVGIVAVILSITAIILSVWELVYRRGEQKKQYLLYMARRYRKNDPFLRYADKTAKCRVVLETYCERYHICYRRVKKTYELVINGRVYDEKTSLIHFRHSLTAYFNGHFFKVGFSKEYRDIYITMDHELVAFKKIWF